MSGALLAVFGGTVAGTGSVGGPPSAMAWANILSDYSGSNTPLTVAGITGGTVAPLTATITGFGTLIVNKNGGWAPYTGTFNVQNGDALGWTVNCNAKTSGTVTVKSGTTTIGSFHYLILVSNL